MEMKMEMNEIESITMQEIMEKNKKWFSPENKAFFGDIWYRLKFSASGETILVQYTNAWTDMFDGKKKPHYRIHKIQEDDKVGPLEDIVFKTEEDMIEFLENN